MKFSVLSLAIFLTGQSLLSAAEPPDSKLETTPVGSFDANLDRWACKNGKGAKGTLLLAESAGHHGAAVKLTADFTGGGTYVAMQKGFKSQAVEFHFWIKAADCTAIQLRLTDASKRTFQYTRPLTSTGDWQLITLRDFDQADGSWSAPDKDHPEGVWSAPPDGSFHCPVRSFAIVLAKENIRSQGQTATILVDDVEAVSPPLALPSPRPMPASVTLPPGSIFGVNSHWLHSDIFNGKESGDPFDRVEYTLPFVTGGGFGIVRDVLYQGLLTESVPGDNPDDQRPGLIWPYQSVSKKRCEANRRQVEAYLEMYSKAGVRVILCPFFLKASSSGFQSLFEWIGHLAKTYPCVAGIEMHNEPSLRVFWIDKPEDYAEACRTGTKILKSISPSTPVYVGCISHMWWKPGLQWLQTALEHGLLEGADGVSVHPYRTKSPPEGGSQHAADNDPNGFASEATDWWGMIQRYNTSGKPLKLIFTEVGYSSGSGMAGLGGNDQAKGVSIDRQADYVSRLALVVFDLRQRGLPIDALCWYDLKCDGEGDPDDMQSNFGLIDYTAQTPRPGYLAYSRIARTFGQVADFMPLDVALTSSSHPEAVKSMAWKRLSDGALLIAFWRLDQVGSVTGDFDARFTLPLPPGFQADRVELVDLHQDAPASVPWSVIGPAINVPVKVTSRAAWLVVHPKTDRSTNIDAPWCEGLPASFSVPSETGEAHLTLTGPRQSPTDAPAPIVLTVDNTRGTKPFSGSINLQGRETVFTAPTGKTVEVELTLPVVKGGTARTGWYAIDVANRIVGRGGFTLAGDQVSPATPAVKNP